MSDKQRYWNIFWINVLIATIEISGRVITGSIALLSDGLHQIGDAIGNLMSIMAEHLVQKGWNKHKVRGWSGLIKVLLLLLACGEIMREMGGSLREKPDINAPGMALIAGIACCLNWLAWREAKKTKGEHACCATPHLHHTSKNITSQSEELHQEYDTYMSGITCLGGISIAYSNMHLIDLMISGIIVVRLLPKTIAMGIEAVRMIRAA